MTTIDATKSVERLVQELGYDALIDALVAEVETAPESELDAIEALLDAVMANLVAEAGGVPGFPAAQTN